MLRRKGGEDKELSRPRRRASRGQVEEYYNRARSDSVRRDIERGSGRDTEEEFASTVAVGSEAVFSQRARGDGYEKVYLVVVDLALTTQRLKRVTSEKSRNSTYFPSP